MRTSSALSLVALTSAFLLAAASSASANTGYGGDNNGGHQHGNGYHPRAYQQSVKGLDYGYYQKTCPDMEGIVQRAVKKAFAADYTVAAAIIRLFFHDFAVNGCDGSILIDAPGSERHAKASKTLRGFEVIDTIKSELEAKCKQTVSCADILTAAARDASVAVGVDYWSLQYGRKDSRKSSAEEADRYVPSSHDSVTKMIEFFQDMGLDVFDLVVLSGAHTIGHATCGAVRPRLCNRELAMDRRYGDFLRRKCWRRDGEYVELDGVTPTAFDNQYYKNLQQGKGLLVTDQSLARDSRTGPIVDYIAREDGFFKHQFARAMSKVGERQVRTDGDKDVEVRHKCSAVNYH